MPTIDPRLKVPTAAWPADLALAGLAPFRAEIYLPAVDAKDPLSALLRLLEGDRDFMPARRAEPAGVLLVNRARLMWLRLPLGSLQSADELDQLFEVDCPVTVWVSDGREFSGDLLYSAPNETRRVNDYLNQPERFIPLFREREVVLLHKPYICSLSEHQR